MKKSIAIWNTLLNEKKPKHTDCWKEQSTRRIFTGQTYMQAGDSTEQIKGMYLTESQRTENCSSFRLNQYSVSDQVIRGSVKIQKCDLETKDTKAQEVPH